MPSERVTGSSAGEARRELMMWVTAAAVVAGVTAFGVWALHVLVDVPHMLSPWWAIGLVAFAGPMLALGVRPLRRFAGPVLRVAVTVGGLVAMVLAVYVIVVVGLGDDVDGSEHRVLGLSMIAGATAVALGPAVRSRLRDATKATLGRRTASGAAALENFGARMTRAVPMDELLLQLAETLQDTMAPLGAEVWAGEDGVLERTTSVPDRGPGRIRLAGAELAAVSGARVSGTSWTAMWMPALLEPYGAPDGADVRVASITHGGRLLGLIVVARGEANGGFDADDDGLLADLARQVGLALHNVHLDSALQESLEELQVKNRLLQESRARVVTAADESRQKIERDLHDGAQQQLVALAVKLQLARMKIDDPEAAAGLLDDLGEQVRQTIDELRELAHGIYPPLLRDSGLGEALKRAVARAAIPGVAEIRTNRRFDAGVEAAVYFCCLEAMQNAGKYAGPDAELKVTVFEDDGNLVFEVADDGAGFDPSTVSESQGFTNMRDRLGAHEGDLTIESSPGKGTVIRGTLPVGSAGAGDGGADR